MLKLNNSWSHKQKKKKKNANMSNGASMKRKGQCYGGECGYLACMKV